MLFKSKKKNYGQLKENLGYPVPEISNIAFAHMDQMASRYYEFKWHKELGKIFGFYYCDAPQLKVSDLDLVNEIFLKQNKIFNARTWSDYRLTALIKSILFNKGSSWKKMRKIFQPALAEYRIKADDSTVIDDIQSGLDKLVKHFKNLVNSSGEVREKFNQRNRLAEYGYVLVENQESPTGLALEINTYTTMQVITLDVIFRLAFDLDTIDVIKGSAEPSLKTVKFILDAADTFMYKIALAIPISRFAVIPWMLFIDPRWRTYKKFVTKIVDCKTPKPKSEPEEAAKQNAQPQRIRSILLNHYRAGNLSRNELMSNSFAILVAGFETTATTATYILWCIAKHQTCAAKLRSDILSYGVESKYLDMFIKEVMRMYPALPNFVIRTPHEDTNVKGFTIKRGMSVYMSVNSIHHDPTIWEDPFRFDPERFDEGKSYPPGAYAPFGLGHRMCAGYQLALREMKSIVCELMANFDIQLIAPQEMELISSSIFLTRPKHEIRLRLVPLTAETPSTQPNDSEKVSNDETSKEIPSAVGTRRSTSNSKLSTKFTTIKGISEELEVDDSTEEIREIPSSQLRSNL